MGSRCSCATDTATGLMALPSAAALLAAAASAAAGHAPPAGPAAATGGCADDCSLNGVCSAEGACTCDAPWAGPACGVLQTRRAPTKTMYGNDPTAATNVSSWGGSVVTDDEGVHHLFVAQMETGGLAGWSSNSECVHATSQSPAGPYAARDVVLGVWCHGPQALRHNATGEYILAHVGNGTAASRPNPDPPLVHAGFLHHSPSPSGPWTAAATSPPPDPSGAACNMPSIAIHPNGTLFAVCDNGRSLTHVTETNVPPWDAAWAPQMPLYPPGKDNLRWEDPVLWFDRRGNWHILFHVFSHSGNWSVNRYSGHGYSRDGLSWDYSDVEPFDGMVDFTDGTSMTYSTRERPHLLFEDPAARTTPVAVVSAVSAVPAGAVCETCHLRGQCHSCKLTHGRDWTYTVLQPLVGFEKWAPSDTIMK